jgi:C-terminal region of Mon2 protein
LDLLRLVPASMTAHSSTPQRALSVETPPPSSTIDGAAVLQLSAISAQESADDTAVSAQEPEWPKAALISAFRVIKLLADEFLESMGLEVIGQLIQCLSVFAAQTADVNISLTSVEMLWKVSDVAMAPPAVPLALAAGATAPPGASVGGFELFQMMLRCLEDLSLDPRPEVRKSAVNTLFSALTAHAAASLLSTVQLRTVCEKSVFPLFQVQLKSESCRRSYLTNGRDEIASAPELKKGIKMNVHHSRDTANKQWSETRTLSLRGLSRLLRTITKSLLLDSEAWFKKDIWNNALELAHSSIETVGENSVDNNNTEISLAAIDLLFAMLKTVSTPPVPTVTPPPVLISKQGSEHRGDDKSKGKAKTRSAAPVEEMVAERESARDDLWQTTWRALKAAVGVRCLTAELALHMCQGLSGLYASSSDAEFRYSANIQILLEMVVVLSRPRLSAVPDGHQLFFAGASKQRSSVTDIQLHRALIALLKLIRAVDSLAFLSLVSCLSELCFSFQTVLLPAEGRPILLGPCDEKLRMAAGKYLLDIMQASLDDRQSPNSGTSSSPSPPIEDTDKDVPGIPVVVISRGSALAALDVIVKRFHYDICESAMAARVDSSSRQMGASAESTSDSTLAVTGGSDVSSSSGAWFLSSLGRMLISSEVSSPVNPASSSTTPQRRISVGAPMHKFQHARHFIEGMGVMSSSSSSRFRPLFDLTFEIDLLVRATDVCFRITEIDSAAQAQTTSSSSSSSAQRQHPHPQHALSASNRSTSASLSLWSSILSVVACCLSPWRENELMLTVPLIDNPPMPPDSSDPGTVPPPSAVNSLLKILFSSQIVTGTGASHSHSPTLLVSSQV